MTSLKHTPKLRLENIKYVYGEGTPNANTALEDISLDIEGGCVTGLIGHTGCGKSTLVQLLNGLLKPTEGKVYLDGKDIWEDPKKIRDIRFRVGLVFQYPEYQLFEETVYKDIAFGPTNMGLGKDEIDRRVHESMRFVGLDDDLLGKSPFELSGGQKRRVAIAGVIAMEPEVLVLDEPAAGLDPMGREDILGGVRSYQRQRGSLVIIVSHSMEDMARYSDRLIVMKRGRIFMRGTCAEIFSQPGALNDVGLDIPQITAFMLELKSRGMDVNTDIFTVEQARDELLSKLKQKKAGR